MSAPDPKPERLVSLDAYRGFIMILLAASGFRIPEVAKNYPQSGFWKFLAYQFDHVPWVGCSFWDLIQPSFMFMVGVAVPYSYAARKAKGDTDRKILWHTVWRSFLLVMLGVFLSSAWGGKTNWTFVNVLSQIGLGYTFVTLLRGRRPAVQGAALAGILAGTWSLFAFWPLPPATTDYAAVQAADGILPGFFAHWNKNANVFHAFDLWFLNLFPQTFAFNRGGYQTLNFIPSMATMLFGLLAGELLRSGLTPREKFLRLAAAAAGCLVAGQVLAWTVCPMVKRIWTPSFAVFSTGWTFAMLAAFYGVIDVKGWKAWTFPLVVVGMNSIAMYMMGQLMKGWVRQQIETHFGRALFQTAPGPLFSAAAVLLVLWLICFWMYRRRIFLRI